MKSTTTEIVDDYISFVRRHQFYQRRSVCSAAFFFGKILSKNFCIRSVRVTETTLFLFLPNDICKSPDLRISECLACERNGVAVGKTDKFVPIVNC